VVRTICCDRFGFAGGTVLVASRKDQVSINTTVGVWGMAFKTESLMAMLNLVPSNKAKLTIMREKGERLLCRESRSYSPSPTRCKIVAWAFMPSDSFTSISHSFSGRF
jgi:hypothetical protein